MSQTRNRPALSMALLGACLLMSTHAWAAGSTESAGNALAVLIPGAALVASLIEPPQHPELSKAEQERLHSADEGTIQLIKAGLTTVGVTGLLKLGVNRRRPDGSGNDSFPSAHSSVAFMGASFIDKRYGHLYGIPALIGASAVAYSRVDANKHYTSDVLAGAAIGLISGYYFTTPHHGINVMPGSAHSPLGVTVSAAF